MKPYPNRLILPGESTEQPWWKLILGAVILAAGIAAMSYAFLGFS